MERNRKGSTDPVRPLRRTITALPQRNGTVSGSYVTSSLRFSARQSIYRADQPISGLRIAMPQLHLSAPWGGIQFVRWKNDAGGGKALFFLRASGTSDNGPRHREKSHGVGTESAAAAR